MLTMEYRYFDITGHTTPEELKSQYRRLCMKYHPDKGGDKEVFHQVNLEYREILERVKQQAEQQNNTDLFRLINEQIYSIDGYIHRLKVPEPFKPAISYLVEKGINELGKVIKQRLK
jgi:hypothetical protein